MTTATYTPNSPMGVMERFLLGTTKEGDADVIHSLLFSPDGEFDPPVELGGRTFYFGQIPATRGMGSIDVDLLGDRVHSATPTWLLLLLIAYDAMKGTSVLKDLDIDDQYLWQPNEEEVES